MANPDFGNSNRKKQFFRVRNPAQPDQAFLELFFLLSFLGVMRLYIMKHITLEDILYKL